MQQVVVKFYMWFTSVLARGVNMKPTEAYTSLNNPLLHNIISFFRPVNLLDSYEDRFIYSFAFAATASNIVSVVLLEDFAVVFGEEFRSVQGQYPSYLKGTNYKNY